jgi:hypothetical protein
VLATKDLYYHWRGQGWRSVMHYLHKTYLLPEDLDIESATEDLFSNERTG